MSIPAIPRSTIRASVRASCAVRQPFEPTRRICAAGAALDRAGEAGLAERSLANPARPAVSGAGRLAARFPAAAAIAAARRSGRLSASRPGRSVRRAESRCPIRASPIRSALMRSAPRPAKRPRRRSRPRPWSCSDVAARPPATRTAGPHGADRRSPRRTLVCVHAAGRKARGLSRTSRRDRVDRGRTRPAGACRRL